MLYEIGILKTAQIAVPLEISPSVIEGAADISFHIESTASGYNAIIGVGDSDIIFDVDATGLMGIISQGADTAFEILSDGNGQTAIVGIGSSTIYFTTDVGVGTNIQGESTTAITGWVVNSISGGHAALTNMNFGNIINIGNRYFATSEKGLFEITGTKDNGVDIVAYASTPTSDFESRKLKSIADCYINVRTNGDIAFRLINDEQTDRSGYIVECHDREGLHRRRKKTHKGLRGTNWQLEVKNINGSTFEVTSVDISPAVLNRSI